MRPAHYQCPDPAPHGWHAGPHGPDHYWYLCAGVRQHPCRCSYLPWYAAHNPLARAMRAGVFLVNPHCPHHGMPAAGWRYLNPGMWVKDEVHVWWAPLGTAVTGADLSDFQRRGRQVPTLPHERRSSVKELTTGNPR